MALHRSGIDKTPDSSYTDTMTPTQEKPREQKEKKHFSILDLFMGGENVSMFQRFCLAMSVVFLLGLGAMLIQYHFLEDLLVENYLHQAQSNLEKSVQMVAANFHNTYAIPEGVQTSRYYRELMGLGDEEPIWRYNLLASYVQKSFSNQVYLLGESQESILYLGSQGMICTREKFFLEAEDCFLEYIRFSETDTQTLLALLKQRSSTFLPAQEVTIGDQAAQKCIVGIIHPMESTSAVMTIYSEEYILEKLGLTCYPQGTYLVMESRGGQLMEAWPQLPEDTSNHRSVSTYSGILKCNVTLYIPDSYFQGQLRTGRTVTLMCILLSGLIGISASMYLGWRSTRQLRTVARKHRKSHGDIRNEAVLLDRALTSSQEDRAQLAEVLSRNTMFKVFSGMVLTDLERGQLIRLLHGIPKPTHLGIIHVKDGLDLYSIQNYLRAIPGEPYHCRIINQQEMGIFLADADVQKLREHLEPFYQDGALCCGISDVLDTVERLPDAIWQARKAITQGEGLRVYIPSDAHPPLTWLQHERLYQCIMEDNETDAMHLFDSFVLQSRDNQVARENYYNVCYILRAAAQELNISLQQLGNLRYDDTRLPWENLHSLRMYLSAIFAFVRERKTQSVQDRREGVIRYIRQNIGDDGLCAATVALAQGLTERSVYAICREVTGHSFGNLLLTLRMEKAAKLLCGTDKKSSQIAQECGYTADSTFYRLFKKFYGQTPNQFRQTGGKGAGQDPKSPLP